MSEQQLCTGKFVQLVPDTWTLEEYCKFICDCESIELDNDYPTIVAQLVDTMPEKYFTYKSKLYMFLSKDEHDIDNPFIKIKQNGRMYEFTTFFHNGGTYLAEMIEEGLDNIELESKILTPPIVNISH